jgi:hypothetical protein
VELTHWLDQQLTEDLLRRYLEAANKGNWAAISVLQRFLQRIHKKFCSTESLPLSERNLSL